MKSLDLDQLEPDARQHLEPDLQAPHLTTPREALDWLRLLFESRLRESPSFRYNRRYDTYVFPRERIASRLRLVGKGSLDEYSAVRRLLAGLANQGELSYRSAADGWWVELSDTDRYIGPERRDIVESWGYRWTDTFPGGIIPRAR